MKKVLKSLLFVFIVLVGVFALTGCAKEEKKEKYDTKLVGQWAAEDFDVFIYTFNKDGSGDYQIGDQDIKFTWKTEGKTLSILYMGDEYPVESEYEVDAKKLNIKDSSGNDVIYLKK